MQRWLSQQLEEEGVWQSMYMLACYWSDKGQSLVF